MCRTRDEIRVGIPNFRFAKNNRPIGLGRRFQRKRSGIKQVGRAIFSKPEGEIAWQSDSPDRHPFVLCARSSLCYHGLLH